MALGKPYRVHGLIAGSEQKYSILLTHRNKEDALLFESNAVAQITNAEVQVIKKNYRPSLESFYGCLGVLQFYQEDDQLIFLVMVSGCVSVGKICESEIFRITQTTFINLHAPLAGEDEKIIEIRKVINSGTFYFAWSGHNSGSFDLTLCEQKRSTTKETDNRFFWNRTLFLHLMRYGIDCSDWLLKISCGSVEIKTVYAGIKTIKAAVISRLSCERAGTRFNVRGTNDEGNVANFVETEQILYNEAENEIASFLQTRGSVPLFWEQPGVQVGSHKVRLSRGSEAACSSLDKHFRVLKERYGRQVIVNLLGSSLVGSKEGEAMLSSLFHTQHVNSPEHADIPHVLFDYHQEVRSNRGLEKLEHQIARYINEFNFFYEKDGLINRNQCGTIRTNCLDCLDRTNCVQTFIGLKILENQLREMELMDKPQSYTRFEEVFRQMWINNGNEVSKIYAGTGAIQGGSKLMDGARSVSRTIQNNLLDQSKQEAIDVLLLGHTFNTELTSYSRSLLPSHYLHAPPAILRAMVKRWEDYTEPRKLRVSCGTYNVNGGKHFRSVVYKDLSLSDWLLDGPKIARSSSLVSLKDDEENLDIASDVFAVGFQEIVDLNAGNIVAASSENKKAWAEELEKILNRDHQYILLTSLQLVGVCLYVFIKPSLLPHVKDVATDSVKTGLGGTTGNKGGVAIRFVLYSTSICFVCSHFAAGQSQVKERSEDYAEIAKKILFPMGRTLESHDYIFWCGDFNYRLDMEREEVKENLANKDLSRLLEADQLTKERGENNVFVGFQEGDITFAPTYKYDLFSEDYDTSEKLRIPAWTDRILWRRRAPICGIQLPPDWDTGRCLYYGRAELKQSDHRPVLAILEVEAFEVNEKKRDEVFKEIIHQLGPPDATIILRTDDPMAFHEDGVDEMILNQLSGCGSAILIRHIDDEVRITFSDGLAAYAASQLETIQVGEHSIYISLKTLDWENHLEKEMALCKHNLIPLYSRENNNTMKNFINESVKEEIITALNSVVVNSGAPPARPGPPQPQTQTHMRPPPSRPPPPRSPATERKLQQNDEGGYESKTPNLESPKKEINSLQSSSPTSTSNVSDIIASSIANYTTSNAPTESIQPLQTATTATAQPPPTLPPRMVPKKGSPSFENPPTIVPAIPARVTAQQNAPPIPARSSNSTQPAIPPRKNDRKWVSFE